MFFSSGKVEGLNGQLPNLDLVNMVNKLTLREGLHPMFKARPHCEPLTCSVLEYGTVLIYRNISAEQSYLWLHVPSLPGVSIHVKKNLIVKM